MFRQSAIAALLVTVLITGSSAIQMAKTSVVTLGDISYYIPEKLQVSMDFIGPIVFVALINYSLRISLTFLMTPCRSPS
jgi:hypothetical protein